MPGENPGSARDQPIWKHDVAYSMLNYLIKLFKRNTYAVHRSYMNDMELFHVLAYNTQPTSAFKYFHNYNDCFSKQFSAMKSMFDCLS